MDRNTFWGLFLILVILVGSTFLMKPSEAELKREKQVQDSIAQLSAKPVNKSNINTSITKTQKAVDTTRIQGPFGSSFQGTEQEIVLENELIKVRISTKGGKVRSVELKGFKTFDGKPLIMFSGEQNQFGLSFNAAGTKINTNDLYFEQLSSSDQEAITLRLAYDENRFIDYVYQLGKNSYQLGLNIKTQGLDGILPINQQQISLNWQTTLSQKEKDLASEQRYSTTYYQPIGDDVESLSVSEDEEEEYTDGRIQWIGFKQHFFSNALIAKNGFDKAKLSVNTQAEQGIVKSYGAQIELPLGKQSNNEYPLAFYFGPNKFQTLQAQGYDLEGLVDLGWGPLKYINRYVVIPVFDFLSGFNWSYGLIILVLTILLKLVLSPLTYKSYLSMAKMRILKPEMDEIKAKVGEDNPTLLQQEYLKLYKKAGVNPLGGCLPMILQLPIIMAFFFFFPNLFDLRQQSFLWMDDLSTYDAFFKFGFNIPFLGSHISLMCVLMTASTLIYTYFNNQISGATGQMKYIGYIMPIIFFGVLNSYPTGLNYYYFLANLLTFGQQFLIRQFVDDEKIHAKIQENKKKPQTEKKSKFQQRMEDYMRQQQQKGKQKK
ncbi:MAG: rane protein insertase YidC [Bacteroidota bacterium]|jgi:YidC/Oxa1 family membrane protein insertase